MMRLGFDDLPSIALFSRVVELRSFTKAAAEAALSKASVSQRISRLEARLEVQLLRRSSRKLSLTVDGMRLYEHAAALAELTRAADDALDASQVPRGSVRLNAPATLHRGRLSRALASFAQRHPAVALQVTLDDRLVDLVEGEFDLLIRVVPPRNRNFTARRLGSERIVVAGAPSYLDQAPPLQTPYDLVQHNCLRNAAIPARVDWRLGARGQNYTVTLRSRFETADYGLLHEAARAGMGLFVTFASAISEDLDQGRLRAVLTEFTGEALGVYLVVGERLRARSAARMLADHLTRALAERA